MAPDLTDAYSKYGADALDTVLTTLFFPTMDPLFAGRPLSPDERADLQAFLARAGGRSQGWTARMLVLGVVAFATFIAAIAWLGRTRLRGVRAALVRRARSGGGRP